jgi:hypothetical protein
MNASSSLAARRRRLRERTHNAIWIASERRVCGYAMLHNSLAPSSGLLRTAARARYQLVFVAALHFYIRQLFHCHTLQSSVQKADVRGRCLKLILESSITSHRAKWALASAAVLEKAKTWSLITTSTCSWRLPVIWRENRYFVLSFARLVLTLPSPVLRHNLPRHPRNRGTYSRLVRAVPCIGLGWGLGLIEA